MHHREHIGRVISDKMERTVVVAVRWVQHHPRYRKAIRRVTKLYAHDPRDECRVGDRVRVVEVRPLSKTKRWLVREIVQRQGVVEAPQLEQAVEEVTTPAVEEAPTAIEAEEPEAPAAQVVEEEAPVAVEEAPAEEAPAEEAPAEEAPAEEAPAEEAPTAIEAEEPEAGEPPSPEQEEAEEEPSDEKPQEERS